MLADCVEMLQVLLKDVAVIALAQVVLTTEMFQEAKESFAWFIEMLQILPRNLEVMKSLDHVLDALAQVVLDEMCYEQTNLVISHFFQ